MVTAKPKPKSKLVTEQEKVINREFWKQGKYEYGFEFGIVWEGNQNNVKGYFLRLVNGKNKEVLEGRYKVERKEKALEDALLFKLSHGGK